MTTRIPLLVINAGGFKLRKVTFGLLKLFYLVYVRYSLWYNICTQVR